MISPSVCPVIHLPFNSRSICMQKKCSRPKCRVHWILTGAPRHSSRAVTAATPNSQANRKALGLPTPSAWLHTTVYKGCGSVHSWRLLLLYTMCVGHPRRLCENQCWFSLLHSILWCEYTTIYLVNCNLSSTASCRTCWLYNKLPEYAYVS